MAVDPTGVDSFISEFEHLRAARAEAERNNVANDITPAPEADKEPADKKSEE